MNNPILQPSKKYGPGKTAQGKSAMQSLTIKRLSAVLFLFILSIDTSAYSPLLNTSEVIKKNKVVALTVNSCLQTAGCFKDLYIFNTCGEVSMHQPPMISGYMKNIYDSNCLLTSRWIMNYVYNGDSDSIWSKSEVINLTPDSITFNRYLFEAETPRFYLEETYTEPRKKKKTNAIYDKQGRIIQYSEETLYFPCGDIYEGKHTCFVHYDSGGLIKEVSVYNASAELIVQLRYDYEYQ